MHLLRPKVYLLNHSGLEIHLITLLLIFLFNTGLRAKVNYAYHIDQSCELGIQDFINGKNPELQKGTNSFYFGYTDCPVWINITANKADDLSKIVLNNTTIEELDFYILKDEKIISKVNTGILKSKQSREIPNPRFAFNLPSNLENSEIWIRLNSNESIFGSFGVYDDNEFLNNNFLNNFYSILPFGICISLVLFYGIIFLRLKERLYLFYILYALSVILLMLRINGLGPYYVWFFIPEFNKFPALFEAWPLLLATLFSIEFLRLKVYFPKIRKILFYLVYTTIAVMILALIGFSKLSLVLSQILGILFLASIVIVSLVLYLKHRYTPAIFFVSGWFFVLLGASTFVLINFGIINGNHLAINHIFPFCLATEMILLGLGVSDRFNIIQKEKIMMQNEINSIIKSQNTELELKVAERTKELQEQNNEILSQQEEIKSINEKLEQIIRSRTKTLEEKNRILIEYAYFNAHKVRGPLARILGLINLFKGGHDKDMSFLFENIDLSAQELDKVIKEINRSLTDNEEKMIENIENKLLKSNKDQS